MIDIEKLLKANSAVSDYRIATKATKSYEMFFVHKKLETVRATDTVNTDVRVYVKHDGKIGDSAFSLYESMSEDEAAAKVAAAAKRALLVFNEPYELPEGGKETFERASSLTACTLPEMAAKVADAVFAADCYAGGSINATEIFLYQDTISVKNSRGVDKTEVKYHAMIEAIPTWNEGEESVELYENHRFNEFDAAAITAEIDKKMREVRDRQAAVKPATPMNCRVVLNAREIYSLLGRMAMVLNYSAVYSHSNLFKVGDDVQKGRSGDALTLTVTGAVKGSVDSAAFDEDGVALTEKVLIEDGVVKGYFGSNRFAQYLGETPTGDMRCFKVAPGTLTKEALEAEPYLECVSMSGLQVDLFSDYVGGEIRLAYLFDGEKTVPVTGISMSAKLSEVLAGMQLSTETTVSGSYEGPDKLLMPNVAVL